MAYNQRQMKLTSFTAIVTALQDAGVRYLVAGDLAVNAHVYLRFTKDVDIVVQLVPENIERAFAALATVAYRPSVPIAARACTRPGTPTTGCMHGRGKLICPLADKTAEVGSDRRIVG